MPVFVLAERASQPLSEMFPVAAIALAIVILTRNLNPNAGPDEETWAKLAKPWGTTGPILNRITFWLIVWSLSVMMIVGLVAYFFEKR